mgnify:CR=1 FL=1
MFLIHRFSILIEDRCHACLGDDNDQVSKSDNRQEQPPRPTAIIHFRVSFKVPQLIVPQTMLSSTGPLPFPCQSNWKSTALIIHLISSSQSMVSWLLTSTVIETLYFLSGTCRFSRSFFTPMIAPYLSHKARMPRSLSGPVPRWGGIPKVRRARNSCPFLYHLR